MPIFLTISRHTSRRIPSLSLSSLCRSSAYCDFVTVDHAKGRRRLLSGSSSSASSSNSKKGGKQDAMQRQKTRTTGIPAEEIPTKPTSGSSRLSQPLPLRQPPSSGGFQTMLSESPRPAFLDSNQSGLSRLIIHPNLKQYYFDDDNNATNSVILPPTWESNKSMTIMNMEERNKNDGSRLRSGSSILTNDDDRLLEIDRESLFDPKIHLPHAPQDWKGYEAATPLSDYLMQRIGVSGQPITTAEFMRHALTHPLYGYYTSNSSFRSTGPHGSVGIDEDDWDLDTYAENSETRSNDIDNNKNTTNNQMTSIFGPSGDFVTAPELSSVFGHCLCVWFMTQWQALNRPKRIQLVELGPGKGTLMADILELAHTSKLLHFGQSITSIHLIEASQPLRQEQKATMARVLGDLVELDFVDTNEGYTNDKQKETNTPSKAPSDDVSTRKRFVNAIRVEWHNDFNAFKKARDKDLPTMIILQEFLDALPVHQFQQTEEGWRERMIDVVSAEDEETNRKALEAIASRTHKNDDNDASPKQKPLIPRLRQVLAPQVTPAVELLLTSNDQYHEFPVGTVVEICPNALLLVEDVVRVLEESKGAGLIIDYGEEGTADTLRAFSRHQQVPLTSRPGLVDVTADVDFFALKNCVANVKTVIDGDTDKKRMVSSEIHSFGPVPQGEFLMKMGAAELTMNAIEKPETSEEQAQAMADALKYLVLPEHMGTKFKVLALARKRDGLFAPPGME